MKKLLLLLFIVPFLGCQKTGCVSGNCESGKGTLNYTNGNKYIGEYKESKRHGQGIFTWGDESEWAGDKYIGEWKENLFHGQGTYTYANRDKYIGEWKEGLFHGQGSFTYADGTKESGLWENSRFLGE